MFGMLAGCSSLTNLDLSNFSTENAEDMRLMFNCCSSLSSKNIITKNKKILKVFKEKKNSSNCLIF